MVKSFQLTAGTRILPNARKHILDTLKMMFHPKAGSQIYCNEVCNLLGKACDIECSTKMATDLLEKAYQDADPPVKRKRMKVAGIHCRTKHQG
ncbi:hypothetical protein OS493_004227 [Desmophyllum pertusum]|uniref:Uncharacterized protein n=1 Tax=Desmophyllum pertusum TaxID=174260 RepID=A0A9X0D5H8_9CNID|nr:hypothetical protein OS493_004227 [Desmophyllum pertusum]